MTFILNILKYTFIFIGVSGGLFGQNENENIEELSTDILPVKNIQILFVGNSLTYTNNLPKLVEKSGQQKGIEIKTKMIAFPNYAIIDHWADGEVQKQIATKDFDFVILQQGPSSQNDGREMLIEYGEKFKTLCKINDAKLCFFMVWPSLNYYHTFDGVIKNYKDAATINDAILLPIGTAWKRHFDLTNNFDYYGSDGFHPSLTGSQVAADVIIESLFKLNK